MTALPPGGRVRFLGQRPSVAQRFGREVLITIVRHHTDLVGRRPAGRLPSERGHVLVAVVHLVHRRRSFDRVALVVAEDWAPTRPPQQLSLVAARTTGERTSRIVQLRCGGGCHHSSLPRPRVKSGRWRTGPGDSLRSSPGGRPSIRPVWHGSATGGSDGQGCRAPADSRRSPPWPSPPASSGLRWNPGRMTGFPRRSCGGTTCSTRQRPPPTDHTIRRELITPVSKPARWRPPAQRACSILRQRFMTTSRPAS